MKRQKTPQLNNLNSLSQLLGKEVMYGKQSSLQSSKQTQHYHYVLRDAVLLQDIFKNMLSPQAAGMQLEQFLTYNATRVN